MKENCFGDYWKSVPYFEWEEYIVWLESFTERYPVFSNDLLGCTDVSVSDLRYVKNLVYLFAKVDDYAKKNYLGSFHRNDNESYYFSFRNIGYEIGMIGEGESFYCLRVNKNEYYEDCFINYDDIVSERRSNYAQLIDRKLDILSEMIGVLHESGIPLETIKQVVYSKVESLEKKEGIKLCKGKKYKE